MVIKIIKTSVTDRRCRRLMQKHLVGWAVAQNQLHKLKQTPIHSMRRLIRHLLWRKKGAKHSKHKTDRTWFKPSRMVKALSHCLWLLVLSAKILMTNMREVRTIGNFSIKARNQMKSQLDQLWHRLNNCKNRKLMLITQYQSRDTKPSLRQSTKRTKKTTRRTSHNNETPAFSFEKQLKQNLISRTTHQTKIK